MPSPRSVPLLLLADLLRAHAEALAGARLRRGLEVAPRAVADEVLALHRGCGVERSQAQLRRELARAVAAVVRRSPAAAPPSL